MPPDYTTRSRVLSFPQGRKLKRTYAPASTCPLSLKNSSTITLNHVGNTKEGSQVTVSKGNQWPPPKGELTDVGGDFETTKTVYEGLNSSHYLTACHVNPVTGVNTGYSYEGPIYPINPDDPLFSAASNHSSLVSDNDTMDEIGATAISRCKPTNSVANASTFLGELFKEGLPSLVGSQTWKSRTKNLRENAGSEYLNVQFGWAPLISEVKSLAKAAKHADAVMKQYERDAGGVVRRTYYFPSERQITKSTVRTSVDPYPSLEEPMYDFSISRGDLVKTVETVTRRWFSGAFTYYLPSGYDSRNAMGRLALEADKVYGLTLTPEVLWNLAPWSWAIDWFSNTGDVISNLTSWAKDGLVLRYGYVMEQTTTTITYSLTRSRIKQVPHVQPLVIVTTTKKRRKANPFGFGLTFDALSAFQVSILAALGLSRSGK